MKEIISQDLLLWLDTAIIPWISGLVISELQIFLAVFKCQEREGSKLTACGARSERFERSQYFSVLVHNKKQLNSLFSEKKQCWSGANQL